MTDFVDTHAVSRLMSSVHHCKADIWFTATLNSRFSCNIQATKSNKLC